MTNATGHRARQRRAARGPRRRLAEIIFPLESAAPNAKHRASCPDSPQDWEWNHSFEPAGTTEVPGGSAFNTGARDPLASKTCPDMSARCADSKLEAGKLALEKKLHRSGIRDDEQRRRSLHHGPTVCLRTRHEQGIEICRHDLYGCPPSSSAVTRRGLLHTSNGRLERGRREPGLIATMKLSRVDAFGVPPPRSRPAPKTARRQAEVSSSRRQPLGHRPERPASHPNRTAGDGKGNPVLEVVAPRSDDSTGRLPESARR